MSMLPDDLLLGGGSPLLVGAGRGASGVNLALTVANLADGSLAFTHRPAGIRGNSHLRAAVLDDGRPFAVLSFTVSGGRIVEVDVLADPERLARLDLGAAAHA